MVNHPIANFSVENPHPTMKWKMERCMLHHFFYLVCDGVQKLISVSSGETTHYFQLQCSLLNFNSSRSRKLHRRLF